MYMTISASFRTSSLCNAYFHVANTICNLITLVFQRIKGKREQKKVPFIIVLTSSQTMDSRKKGHRVRPGQKCLRAVHSAFLCLVLKSHPITRLQSHRSIRYSLYAIRLALRHRWYSSDVVWKERNLVCGGDLIV